MQAQMEQPRLCAYEFGQGFLLLFFSGKQSSTTLVYNTGLLWLVYISIKMVIPFVYIIRRWKNFKKKFLVVLK